MESLKVKGIPFLSKVTPKGVEQLLAKDIMCTQLNTLKPNSSVFEIINVLDSTGHNGFPVINKHNNLIGIISRNHLIIILDKITQHIKINYNLEQHVDYIQDLD